MKPIVKHWNHPWDDAVLVPLVELVRCDADLGMSFLTQEGTRLLVEQDILAMCRQRGEKLDAYILPRGTKAGEHCIGVRYGDDSGAYIALRAHQAKTQALLDKYRP